MSGGSSCLNQIVPFFKGIPVRGIGIQEIEKWKVARGAKIAPRTFNKELETLNHVLRYARDVKGLLLEKPGGESAQSQTGGGGGAESRQGAISEPWLQYPERAASPSAAGRRISWNSSAIPACVWVRPSKCGGAM